MLAEHAGDLPPPVDPAQLDLPACHEAEQQDQRRVLVGSEPCVFTRRRNSSWSRSIVFVVRNVFHSALRKRRSPPFPSMIASTGAAFPRRERLASAQLKGAQMFVPVGKDADQAQHGHADHLPGTTHAQGKAIEVDIDHVEGGERACPPGLRAVLQRGHHKVTSAPPEFSSASQFAAFVSASACSSPELHVHLTGPRRRSLEILAGLRLLPCPAVPLAEAEVAVVDEGGMPSSVASAMAWPKESSACSIGRIDSGRRLAEQAQGPRLGAALTALVLRLGQGESRRIPFRGGSSV